MTHDSDSMMYAVMLRHLQSPWARTLQNLCLCVFCSLVGHVLFLVRNDAITYINIMLLCP